MNRLQLLIGIAGLCIGTLIYLTDRSPNSTYLTWKIFHGFSLHTQFPDFFGCLDRSLASFLHSFSFTMISAGIMAASRRGILLIALFWGIVNALFEAGQYFDTTVINRLPDWFENYFILETLDNFFASGTFDWGDVTAASAGAWVAYFVLLMTLKKGGKGNGNGYSEKKYKRRRLSEK